MTRRQLFRLISYLLLGILLVFLLIVYSLYLSAQRMPTFYKETLAVSADTQQLRNDALRHRLMDLNNAVQDTKKTWTAGFNADELNAWFAVELDRADSTVLPPEIAAPRVSFSDRQIDFACRIDQGHFSGVLHLSLGIELPEPNRLSLRLKNARLGTLPISRDIPQRLIAEALEKKGYEVKTGEIGGDPAVSFVFNLKYGKGKKVNLESLSILDGEIRFSGETEEQR